MTEHVVRVPQQENLGLVVLRAVPCDRHEGYVLECPDCLTGEQAQQRGLPVVTDDLGIVADSTWRRWSLARIRSERRTRQVNRRIRNG